MNSQSPLPQSHVCVLQTALDLLERDIDVHILADGVSSCNHEEVGIALARLRESGAQITTSESALFQIMGELKILRCVGACLVYG